MLAQRASDSSKILEIPVHVSTFRSLYDRHAINRVDLLLVDTGGFDYEVLKMALFDGLAIPRLIRYEHLHLSTADRNACVDLLVRNGYKLLRDGRDTLAFRKKTV